MRSLILRNSECSMPMNTFNACYLITCKTEFLRWNLTACYKATVSHTWLSTFATSPLQFSSDGNCKVCQNVLEPITRDMAYY